MMMGSENGTRLCPICGHDTCQCMLGDPRYLARQVGMLLRGKNGGNDDADRTADERYSPAWVIDAVRRVMGGIDLDPASCRQANETVRADRYYTRETDGLTKPWNGRVFLNPPFSLGLRAWTAKLTAEIEAGRVEQAVVVAPTDMLVHLADRWFSTLISGCLLLPDRRIEFYDPATGRLTGPRFGVFVSYMGHAQSRFNQEFRERGTILQRVPGQSLLTRGEAGSHATSEGGFDSETTGGAR
jgi:ParB family chromosome partitioning protein